MPKKPQPTRTTQVTAIAHRRWIQVLYEIQIAFLAAVGVRPPQFELGIAFVVCDLSSDWSGLQGKGFVACAIEKGEPVTGATSDTTPRAFVWRLKQHEIISNDVLGGITRANFQSR